MCMQSDHISGCNQIWTPSDKRGVADVHTVDIIYIIYTIYIIYIACAT